MPGEAITREEAVKLAKKLRAEGRNYDDIATIINGMGYRNEKDGPKSKKGTPISGGGVWCWINQDKKKAYRKKRKKQQEELMEKILAEQNVHHGTYYDEDGYMVTVNASNVKPKPKPRPPAPVTIGSSYSDLTTYLLNKIISDPNLTEVQKAEATQTLFMGILQRKDGNNGLLR